MKLTRILQEISDTIGIGTKDKNEYSDLLDWMYQHKVTYTNNDAENAMGQFYTINVNVGELIDVFGDNWESSLQGDFPGISFS